MSEQTVGPTPNSPPGRPSKEPHSTDDTRVPPTSEGSAKPPPPESAEVMAAAQPNLSAFSAEQQAQLEKLSANLARAALAAQGAIAEVALKQADRPPSLSPDPFNVGPALTDVLGRLVSQPERLMRAHADLFERYMALWHAASRKAMAEETGKVLARTLGRNISWETMIASDHNHVALERHGDRELWVHRKGAMSAQQGQTGVLPGSMGSPSFHVEGRGCEEALCSSAHGAGRALSRGAARSKFSDRDLRRQMEGVWYDYRLTGKLRDEAPAAYKDIRAVLKAQRELVKVIRTLRPVLNYKGT